MRLEGRTALVTGAGSGIGRALAVEAAERGVVVYLAGRQLSKLQQTRDLLAPGATAYCIEADITTAAGRLAIKTTIEHSGRALDVLVNNAGYIATGALLDVSDAEVSQMIATNLIAPILLTRDLLPLLEWPRGARIVNIGSVYGDIAAPDFAVYAATKFGLRGLSDALRRELATARIGVTYAAPRATETEGIEHISEALKRQGNRFDDPATVARWIWSAVERERRSVYPPTVERLFVAIQRAFPALIDRALSKRPARAPRRTEAAGAGTTDPSRLA